MVLDEGRNREVRRLLARVGHKVQRLKRVAVGPVRLGDLPTGAVRELTKKEIESLQQAVARGPRQTTQTTEGDKKPRPKRSAERPKKGGREPGGPRGERTIIG